MPAYLMQRSNRVYLRPGACSGRSRAQSRPDIKIKIPIPSNQSRNSAIDEPNQIEPNQERKSSGDRERGEELECEGEGVFVSA